MRRTLDGPGRSFRGARVGVESLQRRSVLMDADDELCLCFHVSRRKVEQFIRVEKPRRVSELSGCFGAGTGCGWCRPFLKRLLETSKVEAETMPSPEQYAAQRQRFRDLS